MTKEQFKQNLIGFISSYLELWCYSTNYNMNALTEEDLNTFFDQVKIGNFQTDELKAEINTNVHFTFNKVANKIVDKYYKDFIE